MTLDTRMYVHDPVDREEAFAKMRDLVNTPDGVKSKDDGHRLMNPPGIGADAWLMMYYSPDGPLRPEDVFTPWFEDDPDDGYTEIACYLELRFDTAYGYRGPNGENCGVLHAKILAEMGQWLDERDIRWSWKNESTGEIFSGEDRYAKLTTLMDSMDAASEWFANVVTPLIMKKIQEDES